MGFDKGSGSGQICAEKMARGKKGGYLTSRNKILWARWTCDNSMRKGSTCGGARACGDVADYCACVPQWCMCMCSGLCARVAGKSRVRCCRPSPGVGVNRRRRNAKTLSVRAPLSRKEAIELYLQEQERGTERCRFSRWGRFGDLWLRAVCWSCLCDGRRGASASGDLVCAEGICDASEILLSVGERGRPAARSSPATRLRAAMRRGAVKVTVGGPYFRMRSAKCLQTCPIDSIPGGRHYRVRRLLSHACSNDDGSGYLGTLREARNFEVVRRTLAAEGFFSLGVRIFLC